MVKMSSKLNRYILGFFIFIFCAFSLPLYVNAAEVNAGLLSDIWFSKIKIENKDNVTIYGSFQNTSNKNISGEAVFYVNDKEIAKKNFSVNDSSVIKLGADWEVDVGEFEIKILITSIKVGEENVSVDTLLKKESKLKVKINRKIDIEYITEVGTNVYNNTVKTIDKIVSQTNENLEQVKTKEVSSGLNSNTNSNTNQNSDIKQDGTVAGVQYENKTENVEKPKGEVLGEQYSVNVNDFKNKPFDSAKNFFISIIQFLLTYWQITLGIILFIIIFLGIKKRLNKRK